VIRAVLFDVGGPLDLETQFEAAIDADIRSGLEREGVAIDDAAYEEAPRWAVDVFAPSIYRAIIWRQTDGDKAKSLRIYDHMQANAAKRNLFELRDGIIDVLETLKGHGLKLGLAANQPVETLERMERAGIRSYFENPGVSGKYGYRKPDVRSSSRLAPTCESSPPSASWSAIALTATWFPPSSSACAPCFSGRGGTATSSRARGTRCPTPRCRTHRVF
jgi:putative hydrolase of the HAD superfamily